MKARIPKHSEVDIYKRADALKEDLRKWCLFSNRAYVETGWFDLLTDKLPYYHAQEPYFSAIRAVYALSHLFTEDVLMCKNMAKFCKDFSGYYPQGYDTVFNRLRDLCSVESEVVTMWENGTLANALEARSKFAAFTDKIKWLQSKPALSEVFWAGTALPVFWLQHKICLQFDVDLVDRISDSANDINTFKCLKEVFADTPVIAMQYTSKDIRNELSVDSTYVCFDFEHDVLYAIEFAPSVMNYYKIDISGDVQNALSTATACSIARENLYTLLSNDYVLGAFSVDLCKDITTKYGLKYDKFEGKHGLATFFEGEHNDMNNMAHPLIWFGPGETRHMAGYEPAEDVACDALDKQATQYLVRRMLHSLLYSVSKGVNRYAYYMLPCKGLNETSKQGYIDTAFDYVDKDCPLSKMREGVDVSYDIPDLVNAYCTCDLSTVQDVPQIYLDSVASFAIVFNGDVEFADSPKEAFSSMSVQQSTIQYNVFRVELD